MSERGNSHTLLHMQEQHTGSERAVCTAEVQNARVQTGCKNRAMPEGEAVDALQQKRISLHTAGALHLPICPLTASVTSMSEST